MCKIARLSALKAINLHSKEASVLVVQLALLWSKIQKNLKHPLFVLEPGVRANGKLSLGMKLLIM
jgi:hypothetical protein